MQAKIEWYKEILELDPSSKVFFPLAKLLADAGQVKEALELLREGGERHPDLLEARFFSLELCARLGDDTGVAEEAGYIGSILTRYPLFWKAWAENLSRRPETRDAALALDFVSVHFQGNPVGWGEVIQRGLEGLFSASQNNLPFSSEAGQFLGQGAPASETALPPAAQPAQSLRHTPEGKEPTPSQAVDAVATEEASTAQGTAASSEMEESIASAKQGEDVYSIRTRTMARLLAEQGDFEGALEIYQELLAKSQNDTEREELDAIIERMQLMLQELPKAAPSMSTARGGKEDEAEEEGASQPGKSQPDPAATSARQPIAVTEQASEAAPVQPKDEAHSKESAPKAAEHEPGSRVNLAPAAPSVDVPGEGANPQHASSPPATSPALQSPPQESPMLQEQEAAAEQPSDIAPNAVKEPVTRRPKKGPRSAMERLALRLERRAAS